MVALVVFVGCLTLPKDICVRRPLREAAADLDRMPPEQIAIVVPEVEEAIGLHGNRFKRHSIFEFIRGQFGFAFTEPSTVLEWKQFPNCETANSAIPLALVPPKGVCRFQ